MSAFFFGPPDRQLFGYHHVSWGAGSGAVLLCYPALKEYQYAHRSMQVFGRRLAESGYHVLRFDYSGTGDSWGDTLDADLDGWVGDAVQAMDELRAASGRQLVDLVGLRIGGLVASRVAATSDGVRRLVLWDPIVDGEAWLDELGAAGASTAGGDHETEMGSVAVRGRFVGQVRAIRPETFQPPRAGRALLLLTQESATTGGAEPLPHLTDIERLRLEQPAPWLMDAAIWTGQVPAVALKRINEWLV
jgi:uncharacterized protein